MEITDAISTDTATIDPETPLSKLRSEFERHGTKVLFPAADGELVGAVTYAQLLSSHRPPEEKVRTLLRHPPTISRTEDVRETARLMVENEFDALPVVEGDRIVGTVTSASLLRLVGENLGALTVDDVMTRDLVSVESDTTLGTVVATLRENGISRVPVLDGDVPEGMISIYDMVDFTVRLMEREQGGKPDGFDRHGGSGSREGHLTHGGFGERAGVETRMIDLPAADVMNSPVETTAADEPLDDAVGRMLDAGYASLVVADDDGRAVGIVTTTDVLRALTWPEEETAMPVQVFNVDLLDDLTTGEIAERIEEIAGKHADMDVLEANVVVHRHQEKQRGTPLLLITVRLFTDRGRLAASGEAFGAAQAFRKACDKLERIVLDEKEHGRTKKKSARRQEEVERLLGWWLEL